ncbi:hypothetical protein NX059_001214 [Plenodomus lindquistii]|nr:hypothetical protein NX059_001214 [Plenodomus lindquistii]
MPRSLFDQSLELISLVQSLSPSLNMSDVTEGERKKMEEIIASKAYVNNPEILPWYTAELEEPTAETKKLFEGYSKVPSADVVAHIKQVRDEAFKIFPYPCLGSWGFLDFRIRESTEYPEVLERVKNGDKLLDLGCCMGQDIRKLVHDGAPSENTYASDIKATFWDLGHGMFLDQSTLKTPFIEADIFDAESELKQLNGKIDIINANSFFHLFDWDDQVKAAKKAIKLLKPVPGSVIIGRQGGNLEAGDMAQVQKDKSVFWHNPESWKKMWEQVSDETGTKWAVEATFSGEEETHLRKNGLVPAGTRFMTFVVRRL